MDTRPIITRAEAKAAGLTRYFDGVPCKNGHVAERKVGNGDCSECGKEASAAWRAQNPERAKATRAAYYNRNAEKIKAASAAYHALNKEKANASCAAYAARNAEKIKAASAAYHKQNVEKIKAAKAEYIAKNPEKIRAKNAAYRARNLDKIKAREISYRVQNAEKIKTTKKAYRKANPERMAALGRAKRARKAAAEGSHTKEDIQRIYEAQNGKCACCKTKVGKKFHVDHIVPLSKGGSNWPSNLQILCPFHNMSKKDRDPIEFSQSLGMLL